MSRVSLGYKSPPCVQRAAVTWRQGWPCDYASVRAFRRGWRRGGAVSECEPPVYILDLTTMGVWRAVA